MLLHALAKLCKIQMKSGKCSLMPGGWHWQRWPHKPQYHEPHWTTYTMSEMCPLSHNHTNSDQLNNYQQKWEISSYSKDAIPYEWLCKVKFYDPTLQPVHPKKICLHYKSMESEVFSVRTDYNSDKVHSLKCTSKTNWHASTSLLHNSARVWSFHFCQRFHNMLILWNIK